MKILVRNRCDKHFTYMDLSYGPNGFCDKSGMRIPETNIVDVVRDTRKNYVRCGYCGKLIKNNPEAIAAHWEEQEKKIDCLKCDWLAPADVANGSLKIKYVHDKENPDLYVCTNKFKVTLNCSYFGNIESDEAKRNCKYRQCRARRVEQISDFFIKYPHAFNEFVTVDKLIQDGWTNDGKPDDYIRFTHPTINTLCVKINNKGIVDSFVDNCNGIHFYYSKRYDKFFYSSCSKYAPVTKNYMERYQHKDFFEAIKELFN